MQTFRKHVKLTYLFIWKTMLQSVILLWKCAVRPGMSVFVMVCETRPLPVYPIVFRQSGLPVAGKHSVFNLIHRHVRSFLLVSLIWHPGHASNLRRRGWWKKPSPIFWIWTAISILHTAPLRRISVNSLKLFKDLKISRSSVDHSQQGELTGFHGCLGWIHGYKGPAVQKESTSSTTSIFSGATDNCLNWMASTQTKLVQEC